MVIVLLAMELVSFFNSPNLYANVSIRYNRISLPSFGASL